VTGLGSLEEAPLLVIFGFVLPFYLAVNAKVQTLPDTGLILQA